MSSQETRPDAWNSADTPQQPTVRRISYTPTFEEKRILKQAESYIAKYWFSGLALGFTTAWVTARSYNIPLTSFKAIIAASTATSIGGTIGFARGRQRMIETLKTDLPPDSGLRRILMEATKDPSVLDDIILADDTPTGVAMVPSEALQPNNAESPSSWDQIRKNQAKGNATSWDQVRNQASKPVVKPPITKPLNRQDDPFATPESVPQPKLYRSWDDVRRQSKQNDESSGGWDALRAKAMEQDR